MLAHTQTNTHERAHAHHIPTLHQSTIENNEAIQSHLLAASGFAMGIETSLAKTLWNAIDKQQAFVLSIRGGADGAQLRLAGVNAALSRIDLVVGALVPFGVGALASSLGASNALVVLVAMQLTVAITMARLLMQTFAQLHSADEAEEGMVDEGGSNTAANAESSGSEAGLNMMILAQALLYFTVLAPGGILLVWLRARKLPEATLIAFVSMSQLFGSVGSWIPSFLLRRSGERLEGAAAKVLAVHAALIVAAAVAVWRDNAYALLLATVLSRASLWGVDLLGRQVIQSIILIWLSSIYFVTAV
jgi:hypothetical protein